MGRVLLHTKSATGCLSCRQRRKKCDEKQPVCSDCDRLGLVCTPPLDYEQAVPSMTDTYLSSSAFITWAAAESSDGHDLPARLSSFSDWLTLIESDNQVESTRAATLAGSTALTSLGLPCASDDELGLATFLPSTALNNLTGVTHQAIKSWTIGERHLLNHFLQYVSRALALVDDKLNPFLRVIVPMALESGLMRHSLLAFSSKWLLHLHGARALLDQTEGYLTEAPIDSLIELYNYLSCVSSITSENTPGRYGPSLQRSIETTIEGIRQIHPLFGVHASLYEAIVAINKLSARQAKLSVQDAQLEAERIELSLQSWNPPEATEPSRIMAEARAVGFAMQWAATMRLLQVARHLKNDDPQIMKASDNILSALSLIRPGSEVEAHLLFPLFMAGIGSMTKPNRLTVEYRLNLMETTIGFGNIFVAHRLLDEVWQRTNQGERVNWEDLMKGKYPGLVLF
ncbi:hypothetical protein GQ53DRAFT_887825 [Thozetella sp. PMI_491]|nr:hypothetical protein GQ53DRAFT_887825 [Thozetella sp. PMI_491]